jgi:hypothetical protein
LISVEDYQLFDIPAHASEQEIKIRHRELSLLHHPRRGGDNSTMALINAACDRILAYLAWKDEEEDDDAWREPDDDH